jgi:hypothetical protein
MHVGRAFDVLLSYHWRDHVHEMRACPAAALILIAVASFAPALFFLVFGGALFCGIALISIVLGETEPLHVY